MLVKFGEVVYKECFLQHRNTYFTPHVCQKYLALLAKELRSIVCQWYYTRCIQSEVHGEPVTTPCSHQVNVRGSQ